MTDKIEYSDSCPVCLNRMRELKRKDGKSEGLIYFCSKCKQRYEIITVHPKIEFKCPECGRTTKLSQKTISNLHYKTILNFYIKKKRIKESVSK